jgi:phospholipid/cholesterol/gamma-HCH transport system substrate-binding protein
MKSFTERNPYVIGVTGVGLIAAVLLTSFNYDKLPFFNTDITYQAYFAEAGGLTAGADVQVSGSPVGRVESLQLDGDKVLVAFRIEHAINLGDRTEAAIKTRSLLGAKILEITPRGDGHQHGPIPVERTTPPYQLPDALGDLATTISGLDTGALSQSLATLADTFADTPPQLSAAVAGVTRFSQAVNTRDEQLRKLLDEANTVTTVIGERRTQILSLINDTNALFAQLQTQSAALDHVSGNLTALAHQISGFIADNRTQMKPALDKLNGVLTLVDNRKERVQEALTLLNGYLMALGEALSAGPFFKAYVANLIPGQFIQPFVDAAFSDLGLDPNVLLPSERVDPQTGQPGTPALPVPYPRTGQGGEPRLNLPDAITGHPGDTRYPYREPEPAPPPGGAPPGPPLPPSTPAAPTPPVHVTAPNEAVPPPTNPEGTP